VRAPSAFEGFRFPSHVILLEVRRSRINERGIDVDHVTLYRWVQRFTPEWIDAARPCR